ncbi:hypothetical protein AOL_s00173g174 [Orbilia oligospora ATCC 24927]|uniref:Uncharacterized protein n=1 Tax=Arthrobotrys oligospora (strain ATCC 24927 / CBS 115.81 / DSM 1491) TaxID=756982 RepID=G1XP06_ARTOA|nr:hypothetical protein AOL_s00173g174 [Orbilia oligospora ATCC 24927]EGX45073.1 hypothetical protein AOL_s00173g174 [Orbilia oligospora ATCC 24927]
MKSSTLENEICRQKTEPPEGGASVTQFGVVNWKQSFQPQAIAFYGNLFCSENNLLAIVRLLDERTGAQYVDMSGPNIPPNIRSYRPLNLNQHFEDIRFIERQSTYREAKKMLPGSIYVPQLPNDPLRSSYCVGGVVVPKWSKRYDLSSDDPEKWDVYKQAMEALRKTFNEFKRNPREMKKLLGITSLELPSFNSDLMANIGLNDIQGAQRTIDELYNNMNQNVADLSGSVNLQNCIINPTGQGVPDMKNLVVDPDAFQPPVGDGEIIGSFDSFGNIDAGPTILKKQKLSTQEPKVVGSFNSFQYFPSRNLPENEPESRFEIESTETQFRETIPQYGQALGRGNSQRVPETFWPPQPANQLTFQPNQPFQSPNYQPYMPQFQPRYNRDPQSERNDQPVPQYSPLSALQPAQKLQSLSQPGYQQ